MPSDGVVAAFARSNTNGFFNWGDKDFAVADPTGLRSLLDGFNSALQHAVIDDDLDFDLGQEINNVFGATVKLCVTFLAAETLGFEDGDALQADFMQSFFDFIKFERLDDCFDFFHWWFHPLVNVFLQAIVFE